jgi:acyl-homoserine-lactone acylase
MARVTEDAAIDAELWDEPEIGRFSGTFAGRVLACPPAWQAPRMRAFRRFGAPAALVLLATGCGANDEAAKTRGYHVTIRDTAYGVPHVLADDLPSAAAGLGYTGARDYGCILLDQVVRIRGERAKYFGAGETDANVDSDFAMLTLGIAARGKRGLALQSVEMQDNIAGFVAGFNRYLKTEHLAKECDGKDWAQAITSDDLFGYYYWLAQLGSDDPLFDSLATAVPPTASNSAQSLSTKALPHLGLSARGTGSNGWAIGKERTESGHGMLIANPHFPWEGNQKLHENQITVPGLVDVYGASLLGVAVVNIGFNQDVAWTHTVTTARHFTLYQLTLLEGDPTSYMYDGTVRKMTPIDYAIQVKQDDGSLVEQHRTLWRSHYGAMVNIPALGGWGLGSAYTYRNANEDNFDIAEEWLRMNRAKSLSDLEDVNEAVHGNPWVNTMAVDAAGNALYMDATRTPALSEPALAALSDALANDAITQAVDAQGATLLDGSKSEFEWQDDDDRIPGIVSFAHSPRQERDDYVFNANDSYWLTNSNAPLTGYSLLFGDERTARSRRTRMNLTMLDEVSSDGVSGDDGKFSFDELTHVEFNDRGSMAEILRTQVVARCNGQASSGPVGVVVEPDVSKACDVLSAWDGRYTSNSVGAALFREFLGVFQSATDVGPLFGDAFDADHPVTTPATLAPAPATGDDPVVVALGRAVVLLQSAGFDVDTKLGELQHTKKGTETIPIHGATNLDGAFNIVDYNDNDNTLLASTKRGPVVKDATGADDPTGLTEDGYIVNRGSSFMMALEFTKDGPHAESVLSYSQSSDPSSPHYADQTHLFSESRYHPVPFTDAEIEADPELKVTQLDF